jgi:hypothetical protein
LGNQQPKKERRGQYDEPFTKGVEKSSQRVVFTCKKSKNLQKDILPVDFLSLEIRQLQKSLNTSSDRLFNTTLPLAHDSFVCVT